MQVNDDGHPKPEDSTEIAGWFSGTSQDILRDLIRRNNIETVIEIGAFVGKSTVFFAEQVGCVWAVDPFVMWAEGAAENCTATRYGEDFYWKFIENIQNAGVANRVVPIRKTSRQAAETLPPADLVYIDANHDYKSVKEDIALWAPFAQKFICGDDYDENWPCVMRAVDESYPQREVYGNLWIAPIMGI